MSNTFIRRAGIAAALALLLAAGASAETRRITLLGSSDIHGYFVPWDYATDTEYKAGALSKIATAVKRIRAEHLYNLFCRCLANSRQNARGKILFRFVLG